MALSSFLDHRWHGGSVRDWLVAAAAAAVLSGFLLVARRLIASWLSRRAERTATTADDFVLELVRKTHALTLVLASAAIAFRFLELPAAADTALGRLMRVTLLVQIGIWGSAGVGFWVRRQIDQRQATEDAASRASAHALSFFGRLVLWALVLVATLDVFFDVRTLVTGLGIGGIAVALAAQNVLGDLFAAFAIYTDKPFVVGDTIIVDTYVGTVEHIGLKTTRVRSLGGEQIIFGNAELLKARVRNMRRMYERRVLFSLDVSYDTPRATLAHIPQMIREIIESREPVRFDRCHFSAFVESALRIETVYWVLDPDYVRHMDIQQSIFLEVLDRFRAEGIVFAYPTRTIRHEGVGAVGTAVATSVD